MRRSSTRRRKRIPSTREMKATVRAWLAKHHPGLEYVELSTYDHRGSGSPLTAVLGPPPDRKWDAMRPK